MVCDVVLEGRSMDNFSIIYKILKILEKAMDCDVFEIEQISDAVFGITKNELLN